MPIYEFICKPCDERFEVLTTISRANEAACPKCGSDKVKRVMSLFAARTGSRDSSSSGGSCAGCGSSNCASCRH